MDGTNINNRVLIVAIAFSAIATGAAFAGWSAYGTDMFVSMVQSGLAWCL